ncbi:hypothetical protein LguiA_019676 [Lonicera macranthoides]
MRKALIRSVNPSLVKTLTTSTKCYYSGGAVATAAGEPESDSSFTFSPDATNNQNTTTTIGDKIFLKPIKKSSSSSSSSSSSVTMPMSFMTGSIVGKRFYKQVTTREADDGNGWTVMLDYRTLKTPSKRPLKCPTITLAKAIAAEWDYQEIDGIRPFTMPLMKLACTALERVPLTRPKIIEHLLKKFHQDLVFCRAPGDDDLTIGVLERQMEKIDPLLEWVESEFGFTPAVYSSFFGGKQEDGLVDRWGLVEGGHDVDIADLRVQMASAAVFLGLSRKL